MERRQERSKHLARWVTPGLLEAMWWQEGGARRLNVSVTCAQQVMDEQWSPFMKHASPAATVSLLRAQNYVSLKTQGSVLWTEMWVATCPAAPLGLPKEVCPQMPRSSREPRELPTSSPEPGCFMGTAGPLGVT